MSFDLSVLTDEALVSTTFDRVRRANDLDADLLLLLGEISARRLFLQRGHPSMHAFCTAELGFSDDGAYNRTKAAEVARRFPVAVDLVRSGRIHLTALRLLAPVLTEENAEGLLSRACGRSKSEIEELVVEVKPKAEVPFTVRKLPSPPVEPVLALTTGPASPPAPRERVSSEASPPVQHERVSNVSAAPAPHE